MMNNYKFKIVEHIEDDWLKSIFDDEYTVYVKPGVYAMSTRKLEALIYIAKLQKRAASKLDKFIIDLYS